MQARERTSAGCLRWYEALAAGLTAACGLTAAVVVFGFVALVNADGCSPSSNCRQAWVASVAVLAALAIVVAIWAAFSVARDRRVSAIVATVCAIVVWCPLGVILASH